MSPIVGARVPISLQPARLSTARTTRASRRATAWPRLIPASPTTALAPMRLARLASSVPFRFPVDWNPVHELIMTMT